MYPFFQKNCICTKDLTLAAYLMLNGGKLQSYERFGDGLLFFVVSGKGIIHKVNQYFANKPIKFSPRMLMHQRNYLKQLDRKNAKELKNIEDTLDRELREYQNCLPCTPTMYERKGYLRHKCICSTCAELEGCTWPDGHVATFSIGKCDYCNKVQEFDDGGVCDVSDWEWKSHKVATGSEAEREF